MASQMVVAVGSDNIGYRLKAAVVAAIRNHPRVQQVIDFGVHSEKDKRAYPNVGIVVATAVAEGSADRAILICGTGLGMAISANKVAGVRAAVAYDPYSIERSVLSNDCQVLALGSRVVAASLASRIVVDWLSYEFDPDSRSAQKIAILTDYERSHGTSLATHDQESPLPLSGVHLLEGKSS